MMTRISDNFMELIAELPERFAARLHGWVFMDNHYHMLLETPEPNLSQTGQWLNVSYRPYVELVASSRLADSGNAVGSLWRQVRQVIHRDKAWRRRINEVNRQLSKLKM